MGLEKLDTRLGFCVGRGEDAMFPVLVNMKKPIVGEAQEFLLKAGVQKKDIEGGRFVFAISLHTQKIVDIAGKDWVKKIMLKKEV